MHQRHVRHPVPDVLDTVRQRGQDFGLRAALDDAAAAAADDAAARPSGLAAELPAEVAEATAASQLRDNSVSFVAEPLLFGGAATLLSTCLVTTQSDQDFASPTVVDTTGLKPALLRVALASLYFFPVTVGDELAEATVVTEKAAIATAHPAMTIRPTYIGFISDLQTYGCFSGGTALVTAGTDPGSVVVVAVAPIDAAPTDGRL